jgi:hypothetical protein
MAYIGNNIKMNVKGTYQESVDCFNLAEDRDK